APENPARMPPAPRSAAYECVSGRDQHELRGLRTQRCRESHSHAAQETATTTSTLETFRRTPCPQPLQVSATGCVPRGRCPPVSASAPRPRTTRRLTPPRACG